MIYSILSIYFTINIICALVLLFVSFAFAKAMNPNKPFRLHKHEIIIGLKALAFGSLWIIYVIFSELIQYFKNLYK